MEKPLWKSWTVWGVILWSIVAALKELAGLNPEFAIIASTIAIILTGLGVRRALD